MWISQISHMWHHPSLHTHHPVPPCPTLSHPVPQSGSCLMALLAGWHHSSLSSHRSVLVRTFTPHIPTYLFIFIILLDFFKPCQLYEVFLDLKYFSLQVCYLYVSTSTHVLSVSVCIYATSDPRLHYLTGCAGIAQGHSLPQHHALGVAARPGHLSPLHRLLSHAQSEYKCGKHARKKQDKHTFVFVGLAPSWGFYNGNVCVPKSTHRSKVYFAHPKNSNSVLVFCFSYYDLIDYDYDYDFFCQSWTALLTIKFNG